MQRVFFNVFFFFFRPKNNLRLKAPYPDVCFHSGTRCSSALKALPRRSPIITEVCRWHMIYCFWVFCLRFPKITARPCLQTHLHTATKQPADSRWTDPKLQNRMGGLANRASGGPRLQQVRAGRPITGRRLHLRCETMQIGDLLLSFSFSLFFPRWSYFAASRSSAGIACRQAKLQAAFRLNQWGPCSISLDVSIIITCVINFALIPGITWYVIQPCWGERK